MMSDSEVLEFFLETLKRFGVVNHSEMWDIIEAFYCAEIEKDRAYE